MAYPQLDNDPVSDTLVEINHTVALRIYLLLLVASPRPRNRGLLFTDPTPTLTPESRLSGETDRTR